jgi:prevent-host-death family protein
MGASIWSIEEALRNLEGLLKAAEEEGPQEITHRGRRFVVTALPAGKRSAKKFLARGGPLPKAGED